MSTSIETVGIRQISARLWMVSECGADIRKTTKAKAEALYQQLCDKHEAWNVNAPKRVTIATGIIGLDVGADARIAPKYVFNAEVTLVVEGVRYIGCDEHRKTYYVVICNGKRLAVNAANV